MGSITGLDWAREMLYAGFRARWVLLGCRCGIKRGEEIKRSGMIKSAFFTGALLSRDWGVVIRSGFELGMNGCGGKRDSSYRW